MTDKDETRGEIITYLLNTDLQVDLGLCVTR